MILSGRLSGVTRDAGVHVWELLCLLSCLWPRQPWGRAKGGAVYRSVSKDVFEWGGDSRFGRTRPVWRHAPSPPLSHKELLRQNHQWGIFSDGAENRKNECTFTHHHSDALYLTEGCLRKTALAHVFPRNISVQDICTTAFPKLCSEHKMALGELKSAELSYIQFLGLELKKIQFRDGLLFPCSWQPWGLREFTAASLHLGNEWWRVLCVLVKFKAGMFRELSLPWS